MKWSYQVGDEFFQVDLERSHDRLVATIDGRRYLVEIVDRQPGIVTLRIDGKIHTFYWAREGHKRWVVFHGCTHYLERQIGRMKKRVSDMQAEGLLRAPMPAQVRAVLVTVGDPVERGEPLLLLEAMKMEIRLVAPFRGRVANLLVNPGDTVERDQVLIELETGNMAKEQS